MTMGLSMLAGAALGVQRFRFFTLKQSHMATGSQERLDRLSGIVS
jgi:hypothetical protein